jgi:hypothetical protein
MASDEDRWSVATGAAHGKPLILRIRNQPPPFAQKAAFPHLLAVSWEYESPNDQGMPSVKDAQRMTELEELLEAGLEKSRQAFSTVIATGNGVREWQWYARDPEKVMELVNETLGHREPFPVQFSFQGDPEWEGYNGFLGIISQA